jgi:hypothetical protein
MGRHVTCMEKNPKGRDYMVDLVIYGRIILKLIFEE